MSPDNTQTHFNYGIGKMVRSKADIRNELARIKGETGRELIEVGNEVIKKTKPKKSNWVNDEAISDFKKARRGYTKH